jgi:hypothetical protein
MVSWVLDVFRRIEGFIISGQRLLVCLLEIFTLIYEQTSEQTILLKTILLETNKRTRKWVSDFVVLLWPFVNFRVKENGSY